MSKTHLAAGVLCLLLGGCNFTPGLPDEETSGAGGSAGSHATGSGGAGASGTTSRGPGNSSGTGSGGDVGLSGSAGTQSCGQMNVGDHAAAAGHPGRAGQVRIDG